MAERRSAAVYARWGAVPLRIPTSWLGVVPACSFCLLPPLRSLNPAFAAPTPDIRASPWGNLSSLAVSRRTSASVPSPSPLACDVAGGRLQVPGRVPTPINRAQFCLIELHGPLC